MNTLIEIGQQILIGAGLVATVLGLMVMHDHLHPEELTQPIEWCNPDTDTQELWTGCAYVGDTERPR